jgi:hypothetical protein
VCFLRLLLALSCWGRVAMVQRGAAGMGNPNAGRLDR